MLSNTRSKNGITAGMILDQTGNQQYGVLTNKYNKCKEWKPTSNHCLQCTVLARFSLEESLTISNDSH